ncbi:MAG: hypothetical protein ACD_77C00064G0002 [uncultured bacterium]|nr:MAG: hypothetical protein ACD_77C00064G0002 [uncultured bacterium]
MIRILKVLPFFLIFLSCNSENSKSKILYSNNEYTLYSNKVVQGENEAFVISADSITSDYLSPLSKDSARSKKHRAVSLDLSSGPSYISSQPIVDALFNMSLEEAKINIETDSTFRTGAKWGGVWTRDISYSIFLAFAYHQPDVAKISLMKKVSRNRIVQDTGSGGAWPVSSDRIVWVIAAWEIYKVTGDEAWLRQIYPIIKNTLDDDYKTLYNPQTGLYRGESSFLDWREQTYPKWMSNADIYTSENLGTNALHYQANKIIELISRILEEEGEVYLERSAAIKSDINKHFWIAERGFYGQYLYGREYLNISPRFEALGESLSVLFDIADINKAVSIFEKSPVTSFGTTCIYPQIPGIPPYHNNAIWPFVQSYWNLAAAKTGNERALVHGLASIYRAGAFFLTNYENFVAQTGDYNGTEINSDRMLWSMAGNIAMVHRVFIGMNFDVDGIRFNPVIPRVFSGTRTLRNFKYRKAILNITVKGYGRKIRSITLDGKPLLQNFLPSAINGEHDIEIKMDNKRFGDSNFELVKNHFSLTAPEIKIENNKISWNKVPGVSYYLLYINGDLPLKTQELNAIIDSGVSGEYKVSAVDSLGWESFTSEPLMFVPVKNLITIDIKENGKPYSEISTSVNKNLHLKAVTDTDGKYLFRLRYANGSGPWNTDNKCAIRTLLFNGAVTGTLVFPQRGVDLWNDWGWSNSYTLDLRKGINTIDIVFEEWNNNMNLIENKALLEYAELVRL